MTTRQAMKPGDEVQHKVERVRMVVVNLWDGCMIAVCQRYDESAGGFFTKAYHVRDLEPLEAS